MNSVSQAGQSPGRRFRTTLSIVSHGQGRLIRPLLSDIDRHCGDDVEIVVVLNLPEDEGFLQACGTRPLTVVRNTERKGFGANHNAAFKASSGRHFVVVNPDIRFERDPLPPLLEALNDPRVGAAAPVVLNPGGGLEVSARPFPTVLSLAVKALGRRDPKPVGVRAGEQIVVDWVAGMFVAFRADTFEALGGFDEAFFMYYEDVDLCARLGRAGLKVVCHAGSAVTHDARRTSHRNLRYLSWHLRSAARFLVRQGCGRYVRRGSVAGRTSEQGEGATR